MHRFFVSPDCLRETRALLPEPVAHQLGRVLRMRPGERVVVLDNQDWEYEIELITIDSRQAEGRILTRRPATGEPETQVTLYQCMLKKDNFEWVLQKCTEIGVSRFVPVISQRTVAADQEELGRNKLARWERIITEAAEQSGRGRLPVLEEPVALARAVERGAWDSALIPWEGETARTLRQAITLPPGTAARVAVFVGPEGGFAEHEIALAQDHGVIPVTLGPRILRAETAAMAAALLVLHERGETARPPER